MVLPVDSPVMVSMRGGEGAGGMQAHGGNHTSNGVKLITFIILL